jgi:hypothetical protein
MGFFSRLFGQGQGEEGKNRNQAIKEERLDLRKPEYNE